MFRLKLNDPPLLDSKNLSLEATPCTILEETSEIETIQYQEKQNTNSTFNIVMSETSELFKTVKKWVKGE
jgi:hypothetical protein